MIRFTKEQANTFALAVSGALIFWACGLPLPFLFGPMFMCLFGALAGAKMQGLGIVQILFRTLLGVAAGSSITPDVIHQVPEMALSLAIVPVFIGVIAMSSYPLMRRIFGFDPATSYYSSMPGGLQDLVVFGEEAGADTRVIGLIHATRILLIVSILPIILTYFWQVDLHQRPGVASSETPLLQIALFILCGIGGWQIAKRMGMFGASIIGPMLLTALLSGTGVITQRPPAEMIWSAQFFIGLAVGVRYSGVTLRELRKIVLAGLVNGVMLGVISVLFILSVTAAGLAPSLEALLSFLPGGQGEMVVLALIAGADLTYVVLHHILRIFMVVTMAPLVFKFLEGPKNV